MFSFIKTLVSKSYNLAIVAAVAVTVGLSSLSAFGAEGDPIAVEVPANNINFDGLVSAITGQLFPIMAAAGGLGLAIWIVTMLFKKFKSMGR